MIFYMRRIRDLNSLLVIIIIIKLYKKNFIREIKNQYFKGNDTGSS